MYTDSLIKYPNQYQRLCNVSADSSSYPEAYGAIGNGPEVWFLLKPTVGKSRQAKYWFSIAGACKPSYIRSYDLVKGSYYAG